MKILFFARLREAFGESVDIALSDERTVSEVIDVLKERGHVWASELSRPYRVAINRNMAGPEAKVADCDELAIFPPVTGG